MIVAGAPALGIYAGALPLVPGPQGLGRISLTAVGRSAIDDDVLETLRRLKSQVAEHSKSIRDGIATMHNAMSQQREFLQV